VKAERGNMFTTDCEPGPILNGSCPLFGVVCREVDVLCSGGRTAVLCE
jgi:hypothetical protein